MPCVCVCVRTQQSCVEDQWLGNVAEPVLVRGRRSCDLEKTLESLYPQDGTRQVRVLDLRVSLSLALSLSLSLSLSGQSGPWAMVLLLELGVRYDG